MQTYWRKLPNGTLSPDDAATIEWLQKIKTGTAVGADMKRIRNYKFLRKWFDLVHYAFDIWEPAEGMPEKNFERFRKEVTMLSGYAHEVPSIKGGTRWEADSISFSQMDEETFDALYEATIRALLKFVLRNYTRADVDRVLQGVAEYA